MAFSALNFPIAEAKDAFYLLLEGGSIPFTWDIYFLLSGEQSRAQSVLLAPVVFK